MGGHPSLQQVAQGLVYPGLEHLQGWAPPAALTTALTQKL